ncbi:hypothetical protein JB92DRAFT_2895897 [Gautieria morchelliformis]|nr:hypothetical protein JB92DRAFT_2895897 [Gautieria morchelliformis]
MSRKLSTYLGLPVHIKNSILEHMPLSSLWIISESGRFCLLFFSFLFRLERTYLSRDLGCIKI